MRIDLLVSNKKFYTEEGYAARNTSQSLEVLGIPHRTIDLSEGIREAFLENAPTLSISFNALTFQLCTSFCAAMNIPHVCWSEGILKPQKMVLHYGVEQLSSHSLKKWEVVAFANVTEGLVKSLKGLNVDIFGEHEGKDWLLRLPPAMHLHRSLPYIEHFEILQQSKIAFLSATSPWYWPAIAAGCLPEEDPEKIVYYLSHQKEKENELMRLGRELPHFTWVNQIKKLIREIQCPSW